MKTLLYIVSLVTISSILFSCSQNDQQEGNVIPEEKFIDVLVDVHLADAILSIDIERENPEIYVPDNFYFHILSNHEITRSDFNKSVDYYAEDPEVMQEIYQKVVERLSVIEAEIKGRKSTNESGEIVETESDSTQ